MRRISIVALSVGMTLSLAGATLAQSSDAITTATRQLGQASTDAHKANAELGREAMRIRKQIEQTPEWKQALAVQKDGQSKYNLAATAVRKKLHDDPAYKLALGKYQDAQAKRDALRDQPTATPEERTAAATACLEASGGVNRIEQKAIADDPAADQAKLVIQQGNDQLEELKKRFGAIAEKDTAYQAAKQKVQQTQVQVASAQNQLDQAKKAKSRQDEQDLDREIQSRQNSLSQRAGIPR